MDVHLVSVPYHAGDERSSASRGPGRLVEAGAIERLVACGIDVTAETISRGASFRDTAASAADANARLAEAVGRAVRAERLPIVLSGSCNSALGVLAGFDHADCGAVWLDAHGDFNTPESTASGFFPGMSMAIVTGHCYRNYWAQIGDSTPLREELVAMFGVRDLWPEEERRRLERSAIRVVRWRDGKPQTDVVAALEGLGRLVTAIYLHIDFDAFAPEVAPGVADEPVPGGLSLEDAETIVRATAERFRIRAATLATYAPDRDEGEKTLGVALRLIDLLGQYAAGVGPLGSSQDP